MNCPNCKQRLKFMMPEPNKTSHWICNNCHTIYVSVMLRIEDNKYIGEVDNDLHKLPHTVVCGMGRANAKDDRS